MRASTVCVCVWGGGGAGGGVGGCQGLCVHEGRKGVALWASAVHEYVHEYVHVCVRVWGGGQRMRVCMCVRGQRGVCLCVCVSAHACERDVCLSA